MGGYMEQSPARCKRLKNRAKIQEKRWAAKSSKVSVTHACVCPSPDCRATSHRAGNGA